MVHDTLSTSLGNVLPPNGPRPLPLLRGGGQGTRARVVSAESRRCSICEFETSPILASLGSRHASPGGPLRSALRGGGGVPHASPIYPYGTPRRHILPHLPASGRLLPDFCRVAMAWIQLLKCNKKMSCPSFSPGAGANRGGQSRGIGSQGESASRPCRGGGRAVPLRLQIPYGCCTTSRQGGHAVRGIRATPAPQNALSSGIYLYFFAPLGVASREITVPHPFGRRLDSGALLLLLLHEGAPLKAAGGTWRAAARTRVHHETGPTSQCPWAPCASLAWPAGPPSVHPPK